MPHMIPFPGPFALGVAIFVIVIWDAFEAVILPRRVTRKYRLTRGFYRVTWTIATTIGNRIRKRKRRENFLGFYGPSSLLLLIVVWAVGLVFGFGLMQYGSGSAVNAASSPPGFWTDLYMSGTTFFTLGLGDVVPRTGLARALVVAGRGQQDVAGKMVEAPVGGPAACLAGSCSQATLQQIASAEASMAVLHLDPDRIITGQDEARRALSWARERLKEGPVLIASSSTPEEVAALQFRHGRDATGHAIEQAMADIAEGLVRSGVRRLVVAGGETSGAVVDRLGIPGFLVGAEIAAGVPVLRAVGVKDGEMLLALKSGNFGGPAFFSDALELMR